MPDVDIDTIRHECQRILAYTEGLSGNAVQRDTALGDALFLRIKHLHDLAFETLSPASNDAAEIAARGLSPVRQFNAYKTR